MGLFLSFSLLKDQELKKINSSLNSILINRNGGFRRENVDFENDNFSSITKLDELMVITYPGMFTEYNEISRVLSLERQIMILTFSIYDGDYWILLCFKNGEYVSRFNPHPNYWSTEQDRELMKSFNFNLEIICREFKWEIDDIRNYFIEWTKWNTNKKAYDKDNYSYGDSRQLFDLINKIGFGFDDLTNSKKMSETYLMWTQMYPLVRNITFEDIRNTKRYSTFDIKLSETEIEYLYGMSFKKFLEVASKSVSCNYCLTPTGTDEMEVQEYTLSLTELIIKTTGHCKRCGRRLKGGLGLGYIDRLLEILNR